VLANNEIFIPVRFIADVVSIGWLGYVWFHFRRNWLKYAQMFAPSPQPDLWKHVDKHNEIQYCEFCEPPPLPSSGETMHCPKCDMPMSQERGNPNRPDDWFCSRCNELWPNGAARKYQVPFYRRQAVAVRQAQIQSDYVPSNGGWSSWKFHDLKDGRRTVFDTGTPRHIALGDDTSND